MHKNEMKRLVQRPQYYCATADIEYGLAHAQGLDNDPFKVATALSQLTDDRTPVQHYEGLRAWLIAEFMRRRQLQPITEKQELTAFRSIFGWAPQWRFGGGCFGLFDHTFYFRFCDRTKGYLLATHPYNPKREQWTEFGSGHGACIEFVEDYPSWWSPLARGRRVASELIVCMKG